MDEFHFPADPAEDPLDREMRWDKEILVLQSGGRTIHGTGPDGDEPIRFIEGPVLGGPYIEVYEVVDL